MIAFLARLTTFDWVKVVSYAIALLTVFLGPGVLQAWGVSAADAPVWSTRIASAIGVLTLISNSIKNPSPSKGTSPVLAASSTPVIIPTDIAEPPKMVPL